MKWLILIWLLGITLAFCIFALPPLRVALLVAAAVYLIAVIIVCVAYAKELNTNVQWVEQQLAAVRYGTVTEKNSPRV